MSAPYVDVYILPVPTKNLPAYRKIARAWGRILCDYGMIDYAEYAGDDLNSPKPNVPLPVRFKVRDGETLIFAFATFASRAARNRALKKAMADPRMERMASPETKAIFDMKRMSYGGFRRIVGVSTKSG